MPVLPIVVEEILKAAAEAYPHAFDLDQGDIDTNNADDIAQFMSRLNAEHKLQEVPNVSGLEPRLLPRWFRLLWPRQQRRWLRKPPIAAPPPATEVEK